VSELPLERVVVVEEELWVRLPVRFRLLELVPEEVDPWPMLPLLPVLPLRLPVLPVVPAPALPEVPVPALPLVPVPMPEPAADPPPALPPVPCANAGPPERASPKIAIPANNLVTFRIVASFVPCPPQPALPVSMHPRTTAYAKFLGISPVSERNIRLAWTKRKGGCG
jgi:hypothetical protein